MFDKGTRDYFAFEPELIVEVTMVCDRACLGCYAPNIISRSDHVDTLRRRPELFIHPEALRERLAEVTSSIKRPLTSLSFRGGEPTCHPSLPALIDLSMEFTCQLFVESHARWVLPSGERTGLDVKGIINALARPNVALKVSFDSMHRLSAAELERVLLALDSQGVNWLVAITAHDRAQFDTQRAQCGWIPDAKIVFQPQAVRAPDLYTPAFGVIHPDGERARALSMKTGF